MPHTVDIPPPAFGSHPEPTDGAKCVLLSENHPAIATGTAAAGPASNPRLRPPPYRRTIPSYFSRRYSVKERSCCGCCICCCCGFLLIFVFIFAGLLVYIRFSFDPQAPSYKIKQLAVQDFTMQPPVAGVTTLSVALALTVQAKNPNTKISIVYRNGGTVAIMHHGTLLGSSKLPEFRQKPLNMIDMVVAIKGQTKLSGKQKAALLVNQRKGSFPLQAVVNAPLEFTVGKIVLLKMTVDVNCSLVVDNLSPGQPTTVKATYYNVSVEV